MRPKAKLCFFTGYGTIFNHNDESNSLNENIYGSELSLLNLAQELSHVYDIYITSLNGYGSRDFGKLHYIHFHELNRNGMFDVLIVWRYLNYFVNFSCDLAKSTYFWLHDTYALPWLEGSCAPNLGKPIFQNVVDRITKIVVVSEWQKRQIINFYGFKKENVLSKFVVIGNAITDHHVQLVKGFNSSKRVTNRFIWVSSYDRGLERLIHNFRKVRDILKDAELHIYRESTTDHAFEGHDETFIKFKGFLPNDSLILEMLKSDYWLYPTNFDETFCIAALEAQATGCLCVSTSRAALKETIAERGITFDTEEDLWDNIAAVLTRTDQEILRHRAQTWACSQTWTNRAKEWLTMMGDVDVPFFYLNLLRRKDRNEFVRNEFTKAGIKNFTRMNALDATEYTVSSYEHLLFKTELSLPIRCNLLGHMIMWQRVIDSNLPYAIICQDDVYFIENLGHHLMKVINAIPADAEIVWLGMHEHAVYNDFIAFDLLKQTKDANLHRFFSKQINDEIGLLHETINPCSLCYLITHKGAENLISFTCENGVNRATDWHMNDYLCSKGIHYASLLMLATGEPSFGSDIF